MRVSDTADLKYKNQQNRSASLVFNMNLSSSGSVMEFLPLITCPVFIIHGEKDPVVPTFHADYIAKHIKGSR